MDDASEAFTWCFGYMHAPDAYISVALDTPDSPDAFDATDLPNLLDATDSVNK